MRIAGQPMWAAIEDAGRLRDALGVPLPVGVPAAAIFMPLGFFLSMPSPNATAPNRAVSLIYLGALLLAISVLTLGVVLLRTA